MVLYELIGVVRPGKVSEVKEIAKTAGSLILNSGGVIRGVTNWGIFQLPKPYRKHQVLHHTGHHFILRFDSSARTQHTMRRTIALDPRLIRFAVVKLGSKLDDIADVESIVPWGSGVAAQTSDVRRSALAAAGAQPQPDLSLAPGSSLEHNRIMQDEIRNIFDSMATGPQAPNKSE
ncbi:uncharacterized protein K452DRAFT_290479 [Aplosporella prunicola CBS 121167]|uniref:Small ribosomal subunit protein bS6m n=1 Tax=Aplosporella prunicola CBS 121167 TaxID=1176127 RepID=A0A6A6B6F5_9PEZI|nr:uncharacterized protein K452DRAFT_290479 [Aplosporella prunicola CBS 121167]KAF2138834.1 hypothetical protein K452DRAFT_290479 [Aplosporella prunicola CBS 121167]